MPDFSPRLQLPRPLADRSEVADILIVRSLAAALDVGVPFSSGTAAARPAAGLSGRLYRTTDGETPWSLDAGAEWNTLVHPIPEVDESSWPAAPDDGDEIDYLPPTENHVFGEQPIWRLRYNAASSRWRYQGGPPIMIGIRSTPPLQVGPPPGVPWYSLTQTGGQGWWQIPRAGDYMCECYAQTGYGGGLDWTAFWNLAAVFDTPSMAAGTLIDDEFVASWHANNNGSSGAQGRKRVSIAAGGVGNAAYRKFCIGIGRQTSGVTDIWGWTMAIWPVYLANTAIPVA